MRVRITVTVEPEAEDHFCVPKVITAERSGVAPGPPVVGAVVALLRAVLAAVRPTSQPNQRSSTDE